MGNCCLFKRPHKESRYTFGEYEDHMKGRRLFKLPPSVKESIAPFSLKYYRNIGRGHILGVEPTSTINCNCEYLSSFISREHKLSFVCNFTGFWTDILLLDRGNLIRVNFPACYNCSRCNRLLPAALFYTGEKYKLYYKGDITWSAVPSEVNYPADCLEFVIYEVPNFGVILVPVKEDLKCIFYLEDITPIIPIRYTGVGLNLINTVEVGAVAIFKRHVQPWQFFALDENGRKVNLREIPSFNPIYNANDVPGRIYRDRYGLISLHDGRAEFKSASAGKRTKAAIQTMD